MLKIKQMVTVGLVLSLPTMLLSQSPRKFFDAATKFEKSKNYEMALENYTKAIDLDAKYEKAYPARALCYEKLNKKTEAIADYRKAISFDPKSKEMYYNAGRLLAELDSNASADVLLRKAIDRDKGYTEALAIEVGVLFKLKDFKHGLIVTQMAIDDKRTALSLYNHAVNLDSLKNFVEAEKFYRNAKLTDPKFSAASVALALTEVKLNKADQAMKTCDEALVKDPNNADLFYAKSVVHASKKDFQNAINEITKVILSKPSVKVYMERASYYEILGQQYTAVSDYGQAIKLDPKNLEAYLKRAAANENLQNFKASLNDYNKISTLASGDEKISAIVQEAKKKIFELSRENVKPEIEVLSPKAERNIIKVSSDKNELVLKGFVKDENLIKNMNVNSGNATFSADSLNPGFTIQVTDLTRLNEITISATDVYNNTQITQFKLEKTESDKPIIAIETPVASFENEIFIDNNGAEVYIQGKIKDASLIESIMIDGLIASFNPTNLNPEFSAQVKIADKNKITFAVKDIYGNENVQVFTINRSGATAGIDNPMGNTWVVFIENSKYQSFPSLEGPSKDVTAMKAALANYKITKIIHKKDMTKTEMEKFFSIELRDYVKNNTINSLLIWYAGHGKYVSPTGYWVPSDGKTDDEFSYFGINNLKAAMQSYIGKLVHTLVITDACESGATFLMAMRGGDEEKRCDNFELTKAKSAQVYTSAGYELASDNSQFTKTFVSTLNNNVEVCLPIEKIVKKVSAAVSQAGNQAPKFGKIKDLEDEGGTYFFIKK
ncbi:MAG: tetratricopeptide repeat protein [Bacteroidia bacterium]|nr:tetratricopeptide repeat protein [Bacteroidia bacterium]